MSNVNQNELKYWVAFSKLNKIGPVRFKRINDHFPTLQSAWESSVAELINANIEPNIAQEIFISRQEINPDYELEMLLQENINIITIKDEKYPRLLKEIYNPPALLYYKGSLEDIEPAISVVGTRKISSYGKQITPIIVQPLAQNGIIIVSGLAYGIDALAHKTTVEVNGRTIAVLGSGLDKANIYPASNRYLADKIIENNGAVISEYPIGTLPLKGNFPSRNRIIAGLSLGTLIIEGGEESGALITAQLALEHNRDVFAVPGNIYQEYSKGPNKLIKMGARPVLESADILEALDFQEITSYNKTHQAVAETEEEKIILENLKTEPLHIDKIIQLTGLNSAIISSTLTMMEMKGLVKNLGGMNYIAMQ